MIKKVFSLLIIFTLLLPSLALASSAGVHMHNEPSSVQTSTGVLADVADPDSSDVITSTTIDGYMQPGDTAWLVWQTYSQWEQDPSKTNTIDSQEITSFPFTSNWNYFRCWIKVETASTSTDCTLVYFTEITNSNGVNTTFTPLTCDYVDPPEDPPPGLPAPPTIPGAPTFNITNPSMPSGSISIPGSGSFDGTYNYQEPAREGAFTYTPEPLDVPEPIPSPPPPSSGPGLFNFGSIMQSIGTVEQPTVIENPSSTETPITKEVEKVVESPVISQEPLQHDTQGAITPVLQAETPLPVQPANVQPALMDDVINIEIPLQPQQPVTME